MLEQDLQAHAHAQNPSGTYNGVPEDQQTVYRPSRAPGSKGTVAPNYQQHGAYHRDDPFIDYRAPPKRARDDDYVEQDRRIAKRQKDQAFAPTQYQRVPQDEEHRSDETAVPEDQQYQDQEEVDETDEEGSEEEQVASFDPTAPVSFMVPLLISS